MSINYCIMINSPSYGNQVSINALEFTKTLLNKGYNIYVVFFYQNGVYHKNNLNLISNSEINIVSSWKNLAQFYKIKLHICISSAIRRGIINIKNHTKSSKLIENGFYLSSLLYLAQSLLICDRFVQF